MTATQANVYAGIDTHQNTNHVAIINEVGKKLGDREFPTTSTGYAELLAFVLTFGTIIAVGIEGTASLRGRHHRLPAHTEHPRQGSHPPQPANPPGR